MLNKPKTSKAWRWKVATFLPLLALLLMAFGKRGENVIAKVNLLEKVIATSGVIQNQNEQFSQKIEIKKDGNYIGNKLYSLKEIGVKTQEWRKASNNWIFLSIDESIPFNRIDEVREVLNGSNWVIQSTVNSGDLVYFAGDVSQSATFTLGKWDDWLSSQLKNNLGDLTLDADPISFSFIVDKSGKVRDAHLVKKSTNSKINEAFEKMLVQIPDWIPAMRGNEKVSVFYKY